MYIWLLWNVSRLLSNVAARQKLLASASSMNTYKTAFSRFIILSDNYPLQILLAPFRRFYKNAKSNY
jgi:hypothetical protein